MKVRSDFVSNSSSSSFILQNCDLLEYFKIDKQEIINTIEKLTSYKHGESFYVYDLADIKDKEKAIKKFGQLLDEWMCYETVKYKDSDGNIEFEENKFRTHHYEEICEAIKKIYDIDDFGCCDFKITDESTMSKFNYKTKKYDTQPCPKFLIEFLRDLRNRLGIMSNLDVLKCEIARWFIHFDDDGSIIPLMGSYKDKSYKSKYGTKERVIETLFKYWKSIGKIKPKDKEFVKGKNFINEKNYTHEDFAQDVITCNLHEG